NAWAVSGVRTEHGRPLLANDPHLPANLPNLGYLARVKCPSFGVAGVSIIGIPAVITGHHGRAAAGSTAALADHTDLLLEEVSADGKSVLEDGKFVPCSVRRESIAIRGSAPEILEVVSSRRGPIVARLEDPARSMFVPMPQVGTANALSFAATWLRKAPTRAI